ncbi:MAG: DEAD/DEAH box helicase, partial [Methanobacteriota archaeon]
SKKTQALLRELGFSRPTPPQVAAIPRILAGDSVLVIAPTGSGKTEAALLPVLDRLSQSQRQGIGLLYVTPLRALNRDMQGRLSRLCGSLGLTVDIRHGDTPQKDRRRQSAKPPDVLITTPETLQAILPGKVMRRNLRDVRHVIVDEVHQLVQDRRGTQLAVALERLGQATPEVFQRIGLSATVAQPEIVARFFGGGTPLSIIEASREKLMDFKVEWPKPNDEDYETARDLYISPENAASINLMSDLMGEARSTLVFVNARDTAELLGHRFSLVSPDIGVHHGWLPREERERVEREFKAGRLKGIVCTSTLELGIDIGSVDLALQYMSPRQVTSLIQRVGRAGHSLDRVSKGVTVTVSSDDTVESLAAAEAARERDLEPLKVHRHARDVLGHQVVGSVLDAGGRASVESIRTVVTRADPYTDLPPDAFDRVVAFLTDLRLLRRDGGDLVPTSRTRGYYYENLSTIRDERRYVAIDIATQKPVGVLGEEFMMLRARQGYNFIVRGKTWKILKIGEDGVLYVDAVTDPLAATPGWDGDMLSVHFPLAVRTSRLRREIDERLALHGPEEVTESLVKAWPLNRTGVKRLVDEVAEHRRTGAPVPSDRRILIEGFDRFLIVHAGFGEIVNETLGDLLEELLARKSLVRFWWATAHRILLELVIDTKDLDLKEIADDLFGIDAAEVDRSLDILTEEHLPIGYYMKFIAERMGAMKRGLMVAADELNSIELRFRGTPIREEGLREAMLLHTDYDAVR